MEQGTGKVVGSISRVTTHARALKTVETGDNPIRIKATTVNTKRHRRTRRGEREPLPEHVRLAVIRRDGGACELCVLAGGALPAAIEVDHIRPWSAGGSDATINLRVLCKPHNRERSNYVDDIGENRHRIPATWWCLECAVSVPELPGFFVRSGGPEDIDGESGPPCGPGGCSTCHTDWWQLSDVGALTEPILAFCAHCDATRYTLWPL